mmetsp:Transcript_12160/g.33927  ORF Transcript_12160/g.33927 Transcript_12160/m.33927 type:complete len:231 (-) Transcript_12160:428-1120(-)
MQVNPSLAQHFVLLQSSPPQAHETDIGVRLPNCAQLHLLPSGPPSLTHSSLQLAQVLSFLKQVMPCPPRSALQHFVFEQSSPGAEQGSTWQPSSPRIQRESSQLSGDIFQHALTHESPNHSQRSLGQAEALPKVLQASIHASSQVQLSVLHSSAEANREHVSLQASPVHVHRAGSHFFLDSKLPHAGRERSPSFLQLHSLRWKVPYSSYSPSVSPSCTPGSHVLLLRHTA